MRYPEAVVASTQQTASSPRVDAGFKGLRLVGPDEISPRASAVVSGVFQLPEADARRIDGQPHRALVLVVMTQSCAFAVLAPFRELLLFDDDVEIVSGNVRGYFSVRLLDGAENELFAGEAHVHASLGELVSDPITILIR
jgi:hypothetical protein